MKKTLTVKKLGQKEILLKQEVFDESIITVGNNPSATIELKEVEIAPEQFVIISENEQILLMNRANGTIINGEMLDLGSKVEIKADDVIKVGDFQLVLTNLEQNGNTESAKEQIQIQENVEVVSDNNETKKDFSTVLNDLKEEDSFYFQIINEDNVLERVLFDFEGIWLGTSFAEVAIKKDKDELDEIYAFVKKDWSGAVIYPEESEEIYLNDKLLNEPSRLKNEDKLVLVDDFAEEDTEPTIITFHEPVVLLALNSILPENVPEPISISPEEIDSIDLRQTNENLTGNKGQISTKEENNLSKKKKRKRIFGYFSFIEIIIMAFGTLVTAALIFLVLEIA